MAVLRWIGIVTACVGALALLALIGLLSRELWKGSSSASPVVLVGALLVSAAALTSSIGVVYTLCRYR